MSSRPVRVVHVAEAFGGGLLEMVRLICEGHIAAGIDVVVVHGRRPETPTGPLAPVLPDGIPVVEVPGWGSRSVLREPVAIARLRQILRGQKPDVVVFHSSFAGVAGIPMLRSIPTIFVPHAFASQLPGSRLRTATLRLGERAACHRHTMTACVSHSEGGVARQLGAERIRTIPNGTPALDDPVWPEPPVAPAEHVVLGAGRLVPQRQPIEASTILGAVSDLALVAWVGGGGSGDYASQAARALERESVPITGWMPQHEVVAEFARTSVYLHWASWDGLPMTILEAIAQDAVVVASDTEPNREVLGGRAVYSTEADAIAAIRALLEDPDRWRDAVREQRGRAKLYGASRMQMEWNLLVQEMSGSTHT